MLNFAKGGSSINFFFAVWSINGNGRRGEKKKKKETINGPFPFYVRIRGGSFTKGFFFDRYCFFAQTRICAAFIFSMEKRNCFNNCVVVLVYGFSSANLHIPPTPTPTSHPHSDVTRKEKKYFYERRQPTNELDLGFFRVGTKKKERKINFLVLISHNDRFKYPRVNILFVWIEI